MKKITLIIFLCFISMTQAQSVAREWNEVLLNAIRSDFARPTVHARNLFHTSVLMYDAWAIFDSQAETVFLGKTFGGYNCNFNGIATPANIDDARHEVISYAVFRLLIHRFENSPGGEEIVTEIASLFASYGYDHNIVSTDYSNNSYAALGNYLASQMIAFGLQDNSNEEQDYANEFYTPENPALILEMYLDNTDIDPNKWQPLAFDTFIDQSGNIFPASTPEFLSPEWGEVTPFSLKVDDLDILNDAFDCYVYNDPGPPLYIQNSNENGIDDPYKWHFALVASWSGHLDPNDPTTIDISPGAIGNYDIEDYPETFEEYQSFYDFTNGGDASTGHNLNPKTGQPYTPQLVKRSDYARVLAEFWADGPDSETPPGHWFTILNYVSDHPSLEKKVQGIGEVVSDLEWDVKGYLALSGAMHDVAINTWGIKGYYDYVRPISAIRYMAGKGQSTDVLRPNYDPHGLPLITGLIELITENDPLSGEENENVGLVKIKAWQGPDFISSPDDTADVDWIIGKRWWPYQRASFVTPPFAGYLSGHSTFSRAAAEILTRFTGDPFFPDGMGTFDIEQNNFLVFEVGPTEDMTLQWATYRDASDQTSLSRIWGGIHPPIDDIKGRIIGDKIGNEAFDLALEYFEGNTLNTSNSNFDEQIVLYPVPVVDQLSISAKDNYSIEVFSLDGKLMLQDTLASGDNTFDFSALNSGLYMIKLTGENNGNAIIKKVVKY